MDGTSSTLPFADGDGRDESGVSGTALPPTKEFTRADRAKTAIFLRRADELCANWADYVAGGGQYGPEANLNLHRVKSLYIDFRFFISKKEAANFLKFMAVLRPRFRRAAVHRHIAEIQTAWQRGGITAYANAPYFERLMQMKFNAEIFHCETAKSRQLAALREKLSDEDASRAMVDAIGFRAGLIERVTTALAGFRTGVEEYRLP
jgi:hypothetical protein